MRIVGYPLGDLLYRTTALTDASKDVVEAYDCDAYGRTLIFSAAGTDLTWFTDEDLNIEDDQDHHARSARPSSPGTGTILR